MVFAVVGAIWTISILCITFLSLHLYTLHREGGLKLTYAWDKYRLAMLYVLGIATFYFGTARLVSSLSNLILIQLSQRPVPLWYPERWFTLSAMCAVVAFMIGLLNRGEREEEMYLEANLDDQFILPEIRALPAPVIRPEDSTTFLKSVSQPLAPVNILDNEPVEWDSWWTTLQNNAVPAFLTTLGICVVTVIGWLVFSQSGILERIDPSNPTITLADSSQTVTPEITQEQLNGVVNADRAILAQPTNDPLSNVARSAVSAPDLSIDVVEPAIVEPAIAEPTEAESVIVPTAVYTTAIPIELVTTSDVESAIQPAVLQPEPQPAVATLDTPTDNRPVAIVQGSFSVNARFSPSTESDIIKVLPSGTRMPIREWSPNREWLLVLLDDGRSAWVASWVVEVTS